MPVRPTNFLPPKRNNTERKYSSTNFPIVAIGASAGGIEAISELLKNLPGDTGMAFIYVQHLSPDFKSNLPAVLGAKTKMKVHETDNLDLIKPNNIFVIPPGKAIEVVDGHIKVIPRGNNSSSTIDLLFTTLAQEQKERVIGIVLSGNASDGTRGLKAIKEEGGLTFAQDNSAKFASMPRTAAAAGVVDFILSPKEIALELARVSKHPFVKKYNAKTNNEELIDNTSPDLKAIFDQLHKVTGVDFSQYKKSTIKRRIIRRMLLHKLKTLKEYVKLLHQQNEETDILYQDLLINVTNFFRDTDAHEYLKKTLFPKILKNKKTGEALRIWVPACSTGEEAFSLAMLLLELQDARPTKIPVQIFATDLSTQSISKARIGFYTRQDLESVSPKRIQRFFAKADGGYRISKDVRELCVFAPHNVLRDPPFSRLDLVSCCNLFIYLDSPAQKKAISIFHYALNHTGYLLLGKSEAISASAQYFTQLTKKVKIYARKKTGDAPPLPSISRTAYSGVQSQNFINEKDLTITPVRKKSSAAIRSIDTIIDQALITEFLPPSVVITNEMEIVQFRGSTSRYLANAPGKASFNILKMARPEISFELRNVIAKAVKSKNAVRKGGIEMKTGNEVRIISIEVMPLKVEWDEPLILVVFRDHDQVEMTDNNSGGKNSAAKDRRIKKLEEELASAHSDALAFSQEQEAYTEEMQSANEEVVSSNEELQTMNEELETSKEEIESSNEELTTINQELQTRNDLLNESYEYTEAIISTMHEAMIVVDKDLRVKSANRSFYKNFGVVKEETEGILLYDLGNRQWNIPKLRELLEEIIPRDTQIHDYVVEHTFQKIGTRVMSLNANRIIQKMQRGYLVLIIIADITETRKLTREKEATLQKLLDTEVKLNKLAKAKLDKALSAHSKAMEKANIDLEKKNKELSAFNYVSSHDLQEPLRKIQTLASRISEQEKKALSPKGKDYFSRIQVEANHMQELVKDLLAFSHLDSEERRYEQANLTEIAGQVIRELHETIEENNARIKVLEMTSARVVPFQFRQLLYNLISNAIKFARTGVSPNITIKSRKLKHTKGIAGLAPGISYCHITISDNGAGFKNEYREKIFEMFKRLPGNYEHSGTGIGLAIVKKIVDNHNGIIHATGEVNKGARFDIYIPDN